jgi:hypothetical protein
LAKNALMDINYYLDIFLKAAESIDKKILKQNKIEVAVGIYQNSVFLKLYKKSWANPFEDPLTSESRIFFSVWINNGNTDQHKLFYNIHALKLRKLKGYKIESRKFASNFRTNFSPFKNKWPNVSLNFGPLTLMQGWVKSDLENFQDIIPELAGNFLEIAYLIDKNLATFKH